MISLEQLKPGEKATIQEIKNNGADEAYLMEMGLIVGTPVKLIKFAPLGDPLEICVRGYHLSIRRSEARSILVEKEQERQIDKYGTTGRN